MRAIVLVKQVPDVRSARVGIRPDGTIDRRGSTPITNPADLHAIEAALQLCDEVVALSMGPAAADSTLREAISLGVDRAVLLSDRLLAGSDTWATANALAAAIERLGGADLVVGGMAALDGETGQVGPSVAQRLGWPQATGCESISLADGAILAQRIVEGGFEELRVPLPAVVTVAETGFLPRYATLPGRRRAARATIEHLSAADIGVDASRVGLSASPTKVAHMEPAALPDRRCRFVGIDGFGYDDLARSLLELGAIGLPPTDAPAGAPAAAPPAVDGDDGEPVVWVVGEAREGALLPVSLELLTKAAEISPGLGGGVAAVVLGA